MYLTTRKVSDTNMWPSGTFALSRPKLGCPESNDVDWKVGWRFQDTEDTNPRNGRSESFHLDADVELSRGSYVNRSFCNKEKDSSWEKEKAWPQGDNNYFCLLPCTLFWSSYSFGFRQHSRLKGRMITIIVMITDENNFFLGLYHSFKTFSRLWLAQAPRLILSNQIWKMEAIYIPSLIR